MFRIFSSVRVPLYVVVLLLMISVGSIVIFMHSIRELVYNIYLTPEEGRDESLVYGSWPALGNADFFKSVRERFIAENATFIEADLSTMQLTVYEKGAPIKVVAILTKGKEGSWWETPAGLYRVESKEKNHFSSFGNVYQPWSLAFQGNFFIHGWPYYPGGEPVASTYSGGCIRLSSEDAESVYDLVKPGTPVLVFEKDFEADMFTYDVSRPPVFASSYFVADLKSNFVFAEQRSTERLPMASLAKLMTALVATEYVNLEKEILIEEEMLATTSLPRLESGMHITLFQLLYPLLLESSNEAARAISVPLGEKRFVGLMNEKAKALGMTNTAFADAAGSDPENISTAQDLFRLAKYLYNNRSFILKISAGRAEKTIYGSPTFPDLKNFNLFYGDPSFVGGKIGKTEAASETLIAIFHVGTGDNARPIAIILFGSDDVGADARTLLYWLKNTFTPDDGI